MNSTLSFQVSLPLDYEAAVEKVTAALKAEGFGVLTSIDVQATLKKKLDADFRRYVILGACNPPLAYKALQANPSVGLLLPCNVTVEETPEGGTLVSLVNPQAMLDVGGLGADPVIAEVAAEARARFERVVQALKA